MGKEIEMRRDEDGEGDGYGEVDGNREEDGDGERSWR
jgi:hypothetical protein